MIKWKKKNKIKGAGIRWSNNHHDFNRPVYQNFYNRCLQNSLPVPWNPHYWSATIYLVNKFIYGVKIPLLRRTIIPVTEPKRGDIIRFYLPHDRSKDFIKRVIGVGGDKIEIRNKKIFLNGKEYTDNHGVYTDDMVYPAAMQPRDQFRPGYRATRQHFCHGRQPMKAPTAVSGGLSIWRMSRKSAYYLLVMEQRRKGKHLGEAALESFGEICCIESIFSF